MSKPLWTESNGLTTVYTRSLLAFIFCIFTLGFLIGCLAVAAVIGGKAFPSVVGYVGCGLTLLSNLLMWREVTK